MPLIHAAIVVAKAPERYGFVVTPDARPDFERVAVEGAYDLRVVAECAGEPVETLRELEPGAAAARDAGRPQPTTCACRPAGARRCASAWRTCRPRRGSRYRKHVVRRGQTLASIARANGVSAQAIAEANLLVPQRRLRPGTELVIPVPAGKARVVARRAARPSQRRPTDRDHVRYRIQPGRHARLDRGRARHDGARQLQAWNGLAGTRIAAGAVLTIYTDTSRD